MKTIVLECDVFELEIKPKELLEEYRQLIARDVRERFIIPDRLVHTACPGCQAKTGKKAFEKFGMDYIECDVCRTVYVNPRPAGEDIVKFNRDSNTALFWRSQILPKTRDARRKKLFQPQARWVLDVIDRYRPDSHQGITVGYHNDLFVEELVRQGKDLFKIIVTNPVADIEFADENFPNVEIHPVPVDDLPALGPVDVVLAFDILDRCVDPDTLFAAARETLAPGGLLLANTTLSSGFDMQVLWERSGSIYPPDRLNLLSVEGLTALIDRYNFETIEFSTPGRFDIDIVQRAIEEHPAGEWPRFIRYLVENRDRDALVAFQEYLQAYRLSSFARLVLQKPG